MPVDRVAQIMLDGRGSHFEPEYVDAFFKLPSSQVLAIMESERGQKLPSQQIELFKNTTWQRLIELVAGAKPKRYEQGLGQAFKIIYTADLPAQYEPLD